MLSILEVCLHILYVSNSMEIPVMRTIKARYFSTNTETKMLSFWWQFHHWLHWRLSNDNLQCRQWWKFRQNDNIHVSLNRNYVRDKINLQPNGEAAGTPTCSPVVCLMVEEWNVEDAWNIGDSRDGIIPAADALGPTVSGHVHTSWWPPPFGIHIWTGPAHWPRPHPWGSDGYPHS